MTNRYLRYTLLVLGFCASTVMTQAKLDVNTMNRPLVLFTDRTLYLTGENIHFAAFVQNPEKAQGKVLYVEILTPEGQQMAAGKFHIEDNFSSGQIKLPAELISGNYYIKAYTRWMRNFDAGNYFFSVLKIVNPRFEEYIGQKGKDIPDKELILNQLDCKLLQTSLSETKFKARSKAKIRFQQSDFPVPVKWMCVAIAPTASLDCKLLNTKPSDIEGIVPGFEAENEAMLLSGQVIDKNSKEPLSFVTVNLSVLGNKPDFISNLSDSLGRFQFKLPDNFGKNEMYLGVAETGNPVLNVHNDFCKKQVSLPEIPFKLSQMERQLLQNMYYNLEIEQTFYPKTQQNKNQLKSKSIIPFYGSPDKVLIIDEYIDLLSIEEYFHELVFNVGIRQKNDKKQFYIQGNESELAIYNPLVLIDYVAVDKIERLLATQPKLISRIEIIEKPYQKGNMVYGGIISFFSKKNDLAGIDLPETDVFLEFSFFSESERQSIDYSNLPGHLPDTRNTLFWDANFNPSQDGFVDVFFNTSDTKGNYQLLVRGVDSNGNVFCRSAEFLVE
jgi:hypothetical protein